MKLSILSQQMQKFLKQGRVQTPKIIYPRPTYNVLYLDLKKAWNEACLSHQNAKFS